MKVYVLTPIDERKGPWEPWYDKCFGMVVRAASPKAARQLAYDNAGAEGGGVWLDEKLTGCEPLNGTGPAGVVMQDIHAA